MSNALVLVTASDSMIHEERCRATTPDGRVLTLMRKRSPEILAGAPAVILVHGLGQNRLTWDLGHRSLANYLAERKMDVFLLELRGHGLSRSGAASCPRSFEDYVERDAPAAIEAVAGLRPDAPVFWCGHSLGGMIAYALRPDTARRLAGIIAIASPIHFGRGVPLLRYISRHLLRAVDHPWLLRLHPPFFHADLVGRIIALLLPVVDHPWWRPLPWQLWRPGSMERGVLKERVTRGFDHEGVEVILQLFRWAARRDFSGPGVDYRERLKRLRVPILFLAGNGDGVVPLSSIRPGYEMVPVADKTLKIFNAQLNQVDFGHIDIILGDKAPEEVWPYLARWIEERTERTDRTR